MLLLIENLRDDLAADAQGADPQWRVRESLQRGLVVLQTMVRQLDHRDLDDPGHAARFVAQALAGTEPEQTAALLDSTGLRDRDRSDEHATRTTLVAHLVYELLGSMTPRGVQMWFDTRMPQLAGRTPRQLVDENSDLHRPALISLARAGRGQTDRAGTALRAA
jgi:hypothetical protein